MSFRLAHFLTKILMIGPSIADGLVGRSMARWDADMVRIDGILTLSESRTWVSNEPALGC